MYKTLTEYDEPIEVTGEVVNQYVKAERQNINFYLTIRFVDEFDSTNQVTSRVSEDAYNHYSETGMVQLEYARRHPETATIIPMEE